MRAFAVTIFLMLISLEVLSQKDPFSFLVNEGDRYFSEEQFSIAGEYYLKAEKINQSPYLHFRIAECHRKLFQYTAAEQHYKLAHAGDSTSYPLALYYYACMLKLNGKFNESIQSFSKFIGRHETNHSLVQFVEQAYIDRKGSEMACKSFTTETKTPFQLLPPGINTSFNDYAPAFADSNTMVITSGRISSNRQLIDERLGEAFTDNFYFKKSRQEWKESTSVFAVNNSRYHDGSGSFNAKGDKYYFTVCGTDGPQCNIYVSRLLDTKWSEPVRLNDNINSENFDSKQPAISNGGDTLFFVSNRRGGYGNLDIWFSIDDGEDAWGPPMNIGRRINTPMNEMSPSVAPLSNILLFSSEGHEGIGGLDLYMAKRISTGDTLLYNLDYPFNSSHDDCFLTLTDRNVYWSSNRPDGVGGFDIYQSSCNSKLSFVSKIGLKKPIERTPKLKSRTETVEILNLVASRHEERIDYHSLSYEKKKIVDRMVQNQLAGQVSNNESFNLTEEQFEVLMSVANQRFAELLKKARDKTLLATLAPVMDSLSDLSVVGALVDSAVHRAIANVKVMLVDSNGEVLKVTRTNSSGTFKFTDVPSRMELSIKLGEAWTMRGMNPIVGDLEIIRAHVNNILYAENVYFDLDHHYIRPEAAQVLNELATYLKSNPNVQVEIYAFADDLGSAEYNLQLTQRRGQSVVDYLTKQGVDATSLAIIPKGKQEFRITKLERQYNRRVEFYLNGVTDNPNATTKTYILKKHVNWNVIAHETGVDVEQLKVLNGASSSYVKPFQPVRIPVNARSVSATLFFVGI